MCHLVRALWAPQLNHLPEEDEGVGCTTSRQRTLPAVEGAAPAALTDVLGLDGPSLGAPGDPAALRQGPEGICTA